MATTTKAKKRPGDQAELLTTYSEAQAVEFRVEGITKLFLSNGRMADPDDEWAAALRDHQEKGKGNKTEEWRAEMARIAWFGGLYLGGDEASGFYPVMPADNVNACIIRAGGRSRKKNDVTACMWVDDAEPIPILFDGPKDPAEMWESGLFADTRMAVNKKTSSRVKVTRPIFPAGWALEFRVKYQPEDFDRKDVIAFVATAGRYYGIGAYRPKYGRFKVVSPSVGAED